MMVIENKFNISDIVYLKTDREQEPHVLCSIEVTPGDLMYKIAIGTTTSSHYDFELTKEKQLVIS